MNTLPNKLQIFTPADGSLWAERDYHDEAQVAAALDRAVEAQKSWRLTPVAERAAICDRFVDAFVAQREDIATDLSWQMGRPIMATPGEVGGVEERSRFMIDLAAEALAPVRPARKDGFDRYISREPLGIVLIVAPWNYPYLTAVNCIVPALMAGNAVLLKPAAQTALTGERFARAFEQAGLPEGLFDCLFLSHQSTERLIADERVGFVNFTGSVRGGHAMVHAAQDRFIGLGLELGGKDPAYVRHDADLSHAVDNLVDGAFFNSGQSCCGIERIYIDASRFSEFTDRFVERAHEYRLGHPLEPGSTLGPMVRTSAAEFVRSQIEDACRDGAKSHVNESYFPRSESGTPYLAPQVLTDVSHDMRIMSEESFGPVVGIMPVKGDEAAIELMNDSEFGLTASVWTDDDEAAINIGNRVDTGTFFQNRCDYLDPALGWTGVKQSGRGCSLSKVGYEALTHPKSFHLKTTI